MSTRSHKRDLHRAFVVSSGAAALHGLYDDPIFGVFFVAGSLPTTYLVDFVVAPGELTHAQLLARGAIPWTRATWFPVLWDRWGVLLNAAIGISGTDAVFAYVETPQHKPGT